MSKNQPRPKALKRRFSEDEDVQNYKRTRMGEPLEVKTSNVSINKKAQGKSQATDRLHRLKKDNTDHSKNSNKKNNNFIIQTCNMSNSRIVTKSGSAPTSSTKSATSEPPKIEPKIKGTPNVLKKFSINDRLKRPLNRNLSKNLQKSEDETIIIIDNSPLPKIERHKQSKESSNNKLINRLTLKKEEGAITAKRPRPTLTKANQEVTNTKHQKRENVTKLVENDGSEFIINRKYKEDINKKFLNIEDVDDTLVIIDDSFGSILDSPIPSKERISHSPVKIGVKKLEVKENYAEKDKQADDSDSFRLSKSFKVVSEASDSYLSFTKKPSINQRLKNIRTSFNDSFQLNSSGSLNITPKSPEKSRKSEGSPGIPNKAVNISMGLRVPLKRNIFKQDQESSKESNESDISDLEVTTLKESDKDSQPSFIVKMPRPFKRDSPSSSILEKSNTSTSTSSSKSPTKFGTRMIQNSPVKKSSPLQQSSKTTFKQESNKSSRRSLLTERLVRLKQHVSETVNPASKNLSVTIKPQSKLSEDAEMATDPGTSGSLELPKIPKDMLIENWMNSVHSRPGPSNETLSDSMVVNMDETLLNKSVMTSTQQDDSMEWENIPVQQNNESKDSFEYDPPEISVPADLPKKENTICIVTDTNVFMHDMPKLRELLNLAVAGNQKIKIYIPWMVLQELDHLKDFSSQPTKSAAITAQKFINNHLTQQDSKIIGQSVDDVCQQRHLGKCPDNKILACCLQVKEKFESVILLTNDVNLCNKALTSNITSLTPKVIIGKLRSTKVLKIKVRIQTLLSQIIFECCKAAFGDACSKMELLQNRPWSFEACLKRFRRYWCTVFDELLLKQCQKTIEELIYITDRGDISDSDSKSVARFKDKVKELLFYLQDIELFESAVKRMRVEVDSIFEGPSTL